MGGIPQLIEMLVVAGSILAALLIAAFLVGGLFDNPKTRKRILLGTVGVFLIAFFGYFGFIAFILSGNLN